MRLRERNFMARRRESVLPSISPARRENHHTTIYSLGSKTSPGLWPGVLSGPWRAMYFGRRRSADEQQELQLENTKQDASFWESLHEMHTAAIEERKGLIAGVEKLNAESAAEKAGAEAHLEAARERIARIERGEPVSGFGKPISRKDFVKAIGGPAAARFCERVAELYAIGGDAAEKQLVDEHKRLSGRADKTALRTVRKRYGLD
jgi:hypothetical protein